MANKKSIIGAMKVAAAEEATRIAKGKGVPQLLKAMWDISGVMEDILTDGNGTPQEFIMNGLVYQALGDIVRKMTVDTHVSVKGLDCPLYTRYVDEVMGIQLKTTEEIEEVNARLPKANRVSKSQLYEYAPDLAAKYDNKEHLTKAPIVKAYGKINGGMSLIKEFALLLDIIAERQEIQDHYLE